MLSLNDLEIFFIILIAIGFFSFYTKRTQKKLLLLNKDLTQQSLEYNSIIKNANCGILHIDSNENVKQINNHYKNFFKKDITTLDEYMEFLDVKQQKLFYAFIKSQQDTSFEQFFVNSKSEEVYLNIYISFLPQNSDMIIIATSRKDKLKLQQALDRSQIFFNHSDLGHIILDNNLNIVEVNESLCQLTKYRSDELISQSFGIFFKNDILYKSFLRNYLKNNSLSKISNIEYRLQTAEGKMFWVELFGRKFKDKKKNYSIWSIRDISVRVDSRNTIRRLNETLHQEFYKLQEIINLIPMPIFIKDSEFKYVDCNRAFCDFLNLEKDEILEKTVFELFEKEIAEEFHKKDLEMIENPSQKYETQTNNGKKFIELHKKSIYKDNQFNGLVGIIIDITQKVTEMHYLESRVKEELEKNALQREQHQKEQLENVKFLTIGQMAAGITHEINTPLTCIKGNFEMLVEDLHTLPQSKLKDAMLEDTQTIQSGLERVGKIIESMREVSQKHTEKKEEVDIFSTILSSLTISQNRAKHVVQIKLNNQNFDINYVNSDEKFITLVQKQRIEQVWIIIINNALDELVKIENFERRVFNISIFKRRSSIIVQFKDNAGGIDEKILPNIFKPFESTKESSGIGIGLNIAQKIIEDQNGKIVAFNEDKGAVFEVILPIKEKQND